MEWWSGPCSLSQLPHQPLTHAAVSLPHQKPVPPLPLPGASAGWFLPLLAGFPLELLELTGLGAKSVPTPRKERGTRQSVLSALSAPQGREGAGPFEEEG